MDSLCPISTSSISPFIIHTLILSNFLSHHLSLFGGVFEQEKSLNTFLYIDLEIVGVSLISSNEHFCFPLNKGNAAFQQYLMLYSILSLVREYFLNKNF